MNRFLSLLLAMGVVSVSLAETPATTGYYWIDNSLPVGFDTPPTEISTDGLRDGWHMFSVVACTSDGRYSVPHSAAFFKISDLNADLRGVMLIDGISAGSFQLTSHGNGVFSADPDLSRLSHGIHNLQMMLASPSGYTSDIINGWFYRTPGSDELASTSIAYFIDGGAVKKQPINSSGTTFLSDLNTDGLSTGIHSINMSLLLADGSMTPFVSSWFYKTPIPAGVESYEYWFNDDIDNMKSIRLEQPSASFDLVSMLDIPELPFDSRSYAFSLNQGEPQIFAKHQLRMRFFESDGRPNSVSSAFVESRTPICVSPEILQDGQTSVARRNDNEIKWYKFSGEPGDSIVLRLSRPAMYELYSPTGEALLCKKGSQTEAVTTYTLNDNGIFYLAAHDVADDRNAAFDISFEHIPRNAILSVSPAKVSASDLFVTLDVFGNGMEDVTGLSLVSAGGSCVEGTGFDILDNYRLTAPIEIDESVKPGSYDVVLKYTDKLSGEEREIVKKDAICFVETDEKSNITIQVTPSMKATTPYMVDITVTNESEVPCWGLPLNIACGDTDADADTRYVFYMDDQWGNFSMLPTKAFPHYSVSNLLGTGQNGILLPLVLKYLQPHQTRKIRVGMTVAPHGHVNLYAWSGQPYNEESKELLSMSQEELEKFRLPLSNLISLKTQIYLRLLFEEWLDKRTASSSSTVSAKGIMKAPDYSNLDNYRDLAQDYVRDEVQDYVVDQIDRRLPGFSRSNNLAQSTANVAVANGHAISGIANSAAGMHSYVYFRDQCQIPGKTLGDQVRLIEKMYHINDPDDAETKLDPSLRSHYLQAKKLLAKAEHPASIASMALGIDDEVDPLIDAAQQSCCQSSDPMPYGKDVRMLMSHDPNDIHGYTDPSGGYSVGLHVPTLEYEIEFENDSQIASAPASTISVTNILDKDVFDLETFVPQEISIGQKSVQLPSAQNFVITMDLRPSQQCIAEVRLSFSKESGKAVWTFTSLDPMTLTPIEDSREGLLPVNDGASGNGIGTIKYDVGLKDGLAHGTTIDNNATIVFDDNEPIITPTWSNITDYIRPEAKILSWRYEEPKRYIFEIEHSDEGSGVHSYDLCVRSSKNSPWMIVLTALTDKHVELEATGDSSGLEFGAFATDKAGNRQMMTDKPSGLSETEVNDSNEGEERWYYINGTPAGESHNDDIKGIIVSTKGRKILVK